jgi:hypothetical protein
MRNVALATFVITLVCSTCSTGPDTGPCETIFLCAMDECGELYAAEPRTQCSLDCEAAAQEIYEECEQQVEPCQAACAADPPPDVPPEDLETHCYIECDDVRTQCGAPAKECYDTCPDPEWLTCARECGARYTDAPSTPGERATVAFTCDPAHDFCVELRDECEQE